MFGKRYDGRRVRKIDPLERIIPSLMKTRTDSMTMYNDDFNCAPLDAYIEKKKAETGVKYTYAHIIIAAIVRTMAQRPALNRFVMNGKIYTRYKIWSSMAVQRNLRDESAETTLKFEFDGTETLEQGRAQIDGIIADTMTNEENGTDKMARVIMYMPGWLIKAFIGLMKFLDRHEMMPHAIIDASPFHTSFFITNLKSLGINYLYHHVYEFGTTGIFVGLGKERRKPIVNTRNGAIEEGKILTLGFVSDERFCDGLYYARSMRYFKKYMRNPELLEVPLDKKVEDID